MSCLGVWILSESAGKPLKTSEQQKVFIRFVCEEHPWRLELGKVWGRKTNKKTRGDKGSSVIVFGC